MNHKVFVVTDVTAINTADRPDLLPAGQIGIFALNRHTLVSERASTSTDAESFIIALGRSGGRPLTSFNIDSAPKRKNFQWQKTPYRAPVKPIVLVSTDCEGLTSYDDFILKVAVRFGKDLSGMEPDARSYSVTGTFATPTALYTALAAQVNADPDADVVATGTAAGVQLTTKDFWAIIDAGFEYQDNPKSPKCATCQDCNSYIEEMNVADLGAGTAWHVKHAWLRSAAYWGQTYQSDRNITIPRDLLNIADNSTWDSYFLKWSNHNQPTGDHTEAITNFYQDVFIFVPSGTNFTAFEQVINSLLADTDPRVTVA